MRLVDTHCHLNMMSSNNNLDEIIDNAIRNGISRIMVPGIDLESSWEAVRIADKYDLVFASIGYHPNDANKWENDSFSQLLELSKHPKVKAIGEIGLDFYRDYVPQQIQKEVFRKQLKLSGVTGLPIIVHSRNALPEIFDILVDWVKSLSSTELAQTPGILHAFEGNLEQAKFITNLNFMIGIGGPVTYKNSHEKHEIVMKLPIKSILTETDSPFLSPRPYRGKSNEPANIKFIAEKIANLTEKPLKWVSEETSKNANKVFAWEH